MSTLTARFATGVAAVLPADPLDLRTTEDIEAAADEATATLRETLTGLPARPGVRR